MKDLIFGFIKRNPRKAFAIGTTIAGALGYTVPPVVVDIVNALPFG